MASDAFSRKSCVYYYLRMAENNYNSYISSRDSIKIKKYFYVLRPLLNIKWLKEKDTIPPMSFIETVNSLVLPEHVSETIGELLAKKKVTCELGHGPRNPVLDEFIETQLVSARNYCDIATVGNASIDILNDLFREIVDETWSD